MSQSPTEPQIIGISGVTDDGNPFKLQNCQQPKMSKTPKIEKIHNFGVVNKQNKDKQQLLAGVNTNYRSRNSLNQSHNIAIPGNMAVPTNNKQSLQNVLKKAQAKPQMRGKSNKQEVQVEEPETGTFSKHYHLNVPVDIDPQVENGDEPNNYEQRVIGTNQVRASPRSMNLFVQQNSEMGKLKDTVSGLQDNMVKMQELISQQMQQMQQQNILILQLQQQQLQNQQMHQQNFNSAFMQNSDEANSNYQTVKFSSESQGLQGLYNSANASANESGVAYDPLRNSRNISRAGSGIASGAASGKHTPTTPDEDNINSGGAVCKIGSAKQGHQNSSVSNSQQNSNPVSHNDDGMVFTGFNEQQWFPSSQSSQIQSVIKKSAEQAIGKSKQLTPPVQNSQSASPLGMFAQDSRNIGSIPGITSTPAPTNTSQNLDSLINVSGQIYGTNFNTSNEHTNAFQSKMNIVSSSQASEAHQSGQQSPQPGNLIQTSKLNNTNTEASQQQIVFINQPIQDQSQSSMEMNGGGLQHCNTSVSHLQKQSTAKFPSVAGNSGGGLIVTLNSGNSFSNSQSLQGPDPSPYVYNSDEAVSSKDQPQMYIQQSINKTYENLPNSKSQESSKHFPGNMNRHQNKLIRFQINQDLIPSKGAQQSNNNISKEKHQSKSINLQQPEQLTKKGQNNLAPTIQKRSRNLRIRAIDNKMKQQVQNMHDIYGIRGNAPVGHGTEIIGSSGGGLGGEILTDSYHTLRSSKSKSKSKGNGNSFGSKSKNSQNSQPQKHSNSSSGLNQGSCTFMEVKNDYGNTQIIECPVDQFGQMVKQQPVMSENKYPKTKIMVQEELISRQFSRNMMQIAPNSVQDIANKGINHLRYPIKSNNFIDAPQSKMNQEIHENIIEQRNSGAAVSEASIENIEHQ